MLSKNKELKNKLRHFNYEIDLAKKLLALQELQIKELETEIAHSNIQNKNFIYNKHNNPSDKEQLNLNFFDNFFKDDQMNEMNQLENNYNQYIPEDDHNTLEQQIINNLCPNPDNMSYEELLRLEEDVGSVSKGLSNMDIRKIPTVKYNKKKYTENDKCVICQEEFKENEIVSKLGCNHIYHSNCIRQWLKSNKKCPFCMQEIKI